MVYYCYNIGTEGTNMFHHKETKTQEAEHCVHHARGIVKHCMNHNRGIVIHAEDCGEPWASRLEADTCHLNVVGIHPAGGLTAHESLEQALQMAQGAEFADFHRRMNRIGIALEWEMHALSWLVERRLFDLYPHWFRMENGVRVRELNCCASEPEVLDYIRERSYLLAKTLAPSMDTHRFALWLDDVASGGCQCERCRELSASDQAMILTNAIAEGLAAADPHATESYLAYFATSAVPTVAPRGNVYLEYAPLDRDHHRPLFDETCEKNRKAAAPLPGLLAYFGVEHAKVLDYWMDNSLFSAWVRPPKKFTLDEKVCAADVAAYHALGIRDITSFGCYLGADYESLYGAPSLHKYGEILCGGNFF